MIVTVPGGSMYSSALITDTDDNSCGLCDSRQPMEPEHAYTEHLEVTLPEQTFEIVTDRYVMLPMLVVGDYIWMEGLEAFVFWLQTNGYEVRSMRRQFHAVAGGPA